MSTLANKPGTMTLAEALRELRGRQINCWQPTGLQIKIGCISFWPTTGAIHIDGELDGERPCPARGFPALLEILRRRGL